MIRKKHQNIEWLEFDLLQGLPHIQHGVFLRHGGVSEGSFTSLNVGALVGDDIFCVEENRKRIADLFSVKELITGCQVHGVHIGQVGRGVFTPIECDGLITEEKEKALMVQHADCQATIFYDPIKNRLATIHSGWKGSVQNIYEKTVEALKALGSSPSDLLVCISPSLGPEVSEFIHYEKELPPSFMEFRKKECLFDFWEISRSQLLQTGVLPSHIEITSICTYKNKEEFFSYRRDKITGRHATIAKLL